MEENVVNATQEPVVEVQENVTETPNVIDDGVTAEQQPQETAKPVQTQEENAQFAKIRREAEQKAMAKAKEEQDKFAKNYGYESFEELQAAEAKRKLEQEAEARGVTVEEQQKYIEELKKSLLETDPDLKQQQEKLNYYERKEIERLANEDLKRIQSIDSKVKSLDDLGDQFYDLIGAGIDAVVAYHALKSAKPVNTTPSIGDVKPQVAKQESEYFTQEEVDALTKEQLKNPSVLDKAIKSLTKWR